MARKYIIKSLTPGYGPYHKVHSPYPGTMTADGINDATRFDTAHAAAARFVDNGPPLRPFAIVAVDVTPGGIQLAPPGTQVTEFVISDEKGEQFLGSRSAGGVQFLAEARVFPGVNDAISSYAEYAVDHGPTRWIPKPVLRGVIRTPETVVEVA